jgi:hypothetical protein
MFPKWKITRLTNSEAQSSQSHSSPNDYCSKLQIHIDTDFGSKKFRSVLNKHNCGSVKTDNECGMYYSVISELLCSADSR